MTEIICNCEKSFEAEVPDVIDLAHDPGVIEEILTGTFLIFTCPHCGNAIKPEFPLNIVDSTTGVDIFLIPEIDRNRFLLGLYGNDDHDRVVVGFAELVEKLQITKASLDDKAVELLKYYLLVKAGSGANPRIFFAKIENENLVFDIFGLKTDEIGIARIPRALYESACQDLASKVNEEPYKMILEPPYVSVTKIEITEEE